MGSISYKTSILLHRGIRSFSSIPGNFIKCNQENNVRNITLNQPKTRNALSLGMMSDLHSAITENINDADLRVIVISSEGPIFSAGHNLKELTSETGIDYHRQIFKKATDLMASIIHAPVPVIAKVNGLAAAAGCQLVATCDIVICSDKSSFSTPGANFGVFCSTPGIAVGRSVPKSKAMHMLLTGLPVTAQEAYISGLVTKVVPEEDLNKEVGLTCDAIKAKSRSIIALGKKFYYQQISQPILDAFQMGEDVMVSNINMEDGQEGIRSFAEKRKPNWKQ